MNPALWMGIALCLPGSPAGTSEEDSWPQWRGPHGTGSLPDNRPPVEWSEDTNIRWKTPIPGGGHGTPIVWGDLVYVVTAIETEEVGKPAAPEEEGGASGGASGGQEQGGRGARFGSRGGQGRGGRGGFRGGGGPTNLHEFVIMALDREDGAVVWEQVARKELPHEGTHGTGSFAPCSPLTDGEHLYVSFGSRGLYAYSLEGDKLWEVDLGDMRIANSFGEGASPAVHGDLLVVPWDHEGDSFLIALDKHTGEEKWRTPRSQGTTWGTPLIVESAGRTQVVVNGNPVMGYDLEDGSLLWELGGMAANPIPTPIHVDGLVYVASGYRGSAVKAVRLAGAEGKLDGSEAVVWSLDREAPYVPSPAYHKGILYFLKLNSGMLSAVDAATGEFHYAGRRLDLGNVYASPVCAADRVYISDREGTTLVIEHGPEGKVLATNQLDDGCDASLAIVGDAIFLRGQKHLYCIAEN